MASKQSQSELPQKMKAMRVTQFGKPLEVQEIDVPKVCAGEVLVKLNVCGICHTDLHMRNGDLEFKSELPQTLGHEGVGKIVEVGPGVECLKVGDRVLCGVVGDCCGRCENCLDGCETACTKVKLNGCNCDGQLSEYFKVKESFACLIPDNVSDQEAAPINCAGVTTYKALKVSKLWCGQWLAIVGAAGGLGYYCVQYAKAMGLNIIAVDKGGDKIDFLKQFQDIHCLDADKDDIIQKIKQLTGGKGAHAAIVLAPTSEVFEDAPKYLRKRGKIIVVGQHPANEKVEYDMVSLVINCTSVIGSLCGTRCDLREAMKLLADGKIKSETTLREFSEVNKILDELKSGEVTGRMVVKIPSSEE